MDGTRYRALCVAGTMGLLLASGSAALAQQATDQPEWQQYDQLDERYGPLAWLTFGEVLGSPVVDKQGEPIGEIVHLLRAKSGGMFYVVVDTLEARGDDQIVPVDHFEVVGDDEASRKIVMVGEGETDFDASDFAPAEPPDKEQQG